MDVHSPKNCINRYWSIPFSDSVSESRNLGAVFPVFHVTRDHKCVSLTHYLTHYIMIIIVFLEPQRNQKTASSRKFWPIWNKHVFLRSMLWRPRKQLEWGPKTPWWFKAEEFNPDRETYMGIWSLIIIPDHIIAESILTNSHIIW